MAYLSDKQVSFTYPDSFVAMGFMPEFGMDVKPKSYHEKVFLLRELREAVETFGLPKDDFNKQYDNYANEEFEKFIEIQVWDDSPLAWLENV